MLLLNTEIWFIQGLISQNQFNSALFVLCSIWGSGIGFTQITHNKPLMNNFCLLQAKLPLVLFRNGTQLTHEKCSLQSSIVFGQAIELEISYLSMSERQELK